MDAPSWVTAAKALPLGAKVKVVHECGGSGRPSMFVSHQETGWSAFCLRCGFKGWWAKPLPTREERLAKQAREEAQDNALVHTLTLPTPMEFDVQQWPSQARMWLYKAGLSHELIAELGAYFHAPSKRVVLPVIMGNTPVFWIARSVDSFRQPKYLAPSSSRKGIVARYGSGPEIVITEDMLSAFKVGRITEARSVLGTHLDRVTLLALANENRPVFLWLDPDHAGRSKAHTMSQTLSLLGKPVVNIHSDKDPKMYSFDSIQEVIHGARHATAAIFEAPEELY